MSYLTYQGKMVQSSHKYLNNSIIVPSYPPIDFDGNIYTTVTIGTQTWTIENLKTTHYIDGTPIPNVILNSSWQNDASGGYCWFNNNIANKPIYGGLYNWYAVNNIHGLAAPGWHIATDVDMSTLITFAGGASVAGYKLREIGNTHWTTANGTDDFGFKLLPSEGRDNMGQWTNPTPGSLAYLWSSTDLGGGLANSLLAMDWSPGVTVAGSGYVVGFAVRWVKN